MKARWWIAFLSLVTMLSACVNAGNSESGKFYGTNSASSSFVRPSGGELMDVQGSNFVGTWLVQISGNSCFKDEEFEQFPDYHRLMVVVTDGSHMSMKIENFADANCTDKKLTLIKNMTYVTHEIAEQPYQRDIDMVVVGYKLALWKDEYIPYVNQSNWCGINTWVKGQFNDVNGAACNSEDMPTDNEFSRYEMSPDGKILHGTKDRPGGSSTVENRATEIDYSFQFVRQ